MLMDFMRRNTRNLLIALVILVVPAFVLWGAFPTLGKKGSNTVIVVDGVKIPLERFQQNYYQLRETARANLGGNFTPEIEKMLNLKQRAVDGMIQEILFRKEADRLDIIVSDQEVQDTLKQNPAFQTDGKFDATKWNAAIRDPRIEWGAYIESERETLRNQKLVEMIQSAARVTDGEVKEEFLRQNEKVKVKYVTLNAADFLNDVDFSELELADFYENHKNEYAEPARVKLDYVELKKDPSPMDFSDIKAYAADKLEMAKNGADFAQLAQTYSDDTETKANGGDLGFFKKGNPRTKDIEEAAFSLKPGEVSDLIESENGFHIIKVEEVKGSGDEKEVRARDIFFKVVPTEDTLLSLHERATYISHEAAVSSFEETAAKMNAEVKSTPLFVESSPLIPSIGPVREISQLLPGLEQGNVSSVIETPEAFYVVQVVERQLERIPELAEVKEQVISALKAEKALALAQAKAEELVQEANQKRADLAEVVPDAKESMAFTRRGYPPELPRVEGLVDAVFSLEKGAIAGPFADSKRVCIVQLEEKIEPDPSDYDAQKKMIEQRILAQRKQEVFQEYYEALKERAGVKINQELLQLA
jgi:peptidyl-prolyl cis-trans isomerase D